MAYQLLLLAPPLFLFLSGLLLDIVVTMWLPTFSFCSGLLIAAVEITPQGVGSQLGPQTCQTTLSPDLVTTSSFLPLPPQPFKASSTVFKALSAPSPLGDYTYSSSQLLASILLTLRVKSLDSGAELVITKPLLALGNQLCSLFSHHLWQILLHYE